MKTGEIRVRVACAAAACLGLALLAGACGSKQAATTASSSSPTATPTPTNGVANKTPEEILNESKRALGSVTSVHIRGIIGESGRNYTVDMTLGQKTAKGSMTAPMEGVNNASFEFLVAGGRIYIRSNTLWRQAAGEAAAAMLDNRWVLLPRSSRKDFPFVGTKTFAKSLTSKPAEKALSAGPVTMVRGLPTVPVYTSDSVIYVATTGQPYPLRMMSRAAKQAVVDFTGFNAPVIITPPPNPIDLSKLHS